MIYIVHTHEGEYEDNHQYVSSVWSIHDDINVDLLYRLFMVEYAWAQFNLNVNEHWLVALNREDHNDHLRTTSYRKAEKKWNKFSSEYTVESFIPDVLKGTPVTFKELNI